MHFNPLIFASSGIVNHEKCILFELHVLLVVDSSVAFCRKTAHKLFLGHKTTPVNSNSVK